MPSVHRSEEEQRYRANGAQEEPTPEKIFRTAMEACLSAQKMDWYPWKPSSELDCDTLVNMMDQGRFSKIDHILILGLGNFELDNICYALKYDREVIIQYHQDTYFTRIQVVKRLKKFFEEKNGRAVRIEAEDQGYTAETKRGLKSLGIPITPASKRGAFGNASPTTLVYDARRYQTDIRMHIKDFWDQNKYPNSDRALGLPAAVITDWDSIKLESKRPEVAQIVGKDYYVVSLMSRLKHRRQKGSGTYQMRAGDELAVQAKELAKVESKLTREEYAISEREREGQKRKPHTSTFVFEPTMLLLTRKDLTKDLTSLFPPQHISPPRLYHAPGYIPKSELGIYGPAK